MIAQILAYFRDNSDRFIGVLSGHIKISALALLIAVCIAVPVGMVCAKYKKTQKYFVGFFNILRVVPSLAILLLLLPVIGTGVIPASVALILLGIPPIIINTITGFEEVPEEMLEAAKGCGMTETESWKKIEVPLALPLILNGIKTSAVEIIASATLAAKIGAGGLGEIIFTGLGLNRYDLLLIGGVSVAIFSILTNFLFEGISRVMLKYKYI